MIQVFIARGTITNRYYASLNFAALKHLAENFLPRYFLPQRDDFNMFERGAMVKP
jgi:hypothetical protein